MNFTQKIKIGSKYISENSKTFVIAEIGVNHNGSISLATYPILCTFKDLCFFEKPNSLDK